MKVIVSTRGRLVIPAELRERDGIMAGQVFDVERIGPGEYLLVRRKRANEGLVDWLLACPVKGWFQAMDRTETTDDL